MGLRRYRELLGVPGVAPLMLAAFVGRLPYGMNILAAILLLRAAGFDYAEVGIVTAASGLSVGAAAPVMGRVIDRSGRRGCCSSLRFPPPSAARSSWSRCSKARARRW